MKNFNTIQEIWNRQADFEPVYPADRTIREIKQSTRAVHMKHAGTMVVLSLLIAVLSACLYRSLLFEYKGLFAGLSGMIFFVLLRVGLEYRSLGKLKKISPEIASLTYCALIRNFYRWRKKIHYILTPIIYSGYIGSFCMLLPAIRKNVPQGFYIYILVSTIPVFVILGFYILRQIRKELDILRYLNRLLEEEHGQSL